MFENGVNNMVNNVFNVKALNYSVNLVNKYATNNFFAFGKGLINNIICNSDFVTIIITGFLIT